MSRLGKSVVQDSEIFEGAKVNQIFFAGKDIESIVESVKGKIITGVKINKLTFLNYVKNDKFGKALWLCLCDCGKTKMLNASAIKARLTTSCGCNKQKSLRKGYQLISGAFWNKLKKMHLVEILNLILVSKKRGKSI